MFRDPSYFASSASEIVPYCGPIRRSRSGSPGARPARRPTRWRSSSRGGAPRPDDLLRDRHQPRRAATRRRRRVYALDRIARFTREPPRGRAARARSRTTTRRRTASAVFDRSLRKQMVFSDHSLATDSVFAEVQLVSCRNVLIYFDRALQDRALGLLRDSLCRRGFLGLGAKETLRFSAHAGAFKQLERERAMVPAVLTCPAPPDSRSRASRPSSSARRPAASRRCSALLPALPAETPFPVVVVVAHLPRERPSRARRDLRAAMRDRRCAR